MPGNKNNKLGILQEELICLTREFNKILVLMTEVISYNLFYCKNIEYN